MGNDDATALLSEMCRGSASAAERLTPLVYDELHAIAAGFLAKERSNHTLQTTALVHEAYIRLIRQENLDPGNRAQFFALAARVIRRVLIDHARGRARGKRGGDWKRVTITDMLGAPSREAETRQLDVMALHESLERLAEYDTRMAQVVELRHFGGLTIAEAARVLGVSERTVSDDWAVACSRIRRDLSGGTE